MQKKNLFSFHFRVHSNFGKAKVTKSRAQNKETCFFFLPRRSNFAVERPQSYEKKRAKIFNILYDSAKLTYGHWTIGQLDKTKI